MSKKLHHLTIPFTPEQLLLVTNKDVSLITKQDIAFFGLLKEITAESFILIDKKNKKHIFLKSEIIGIVCDEAIPK